MKFIHFTAKRLITILLPIALLTITAAAQQTARIKLESLDKLASKAVEVVRKEERTKDGNSMVYARCFEFKETGDYKGADLQEIRAQLQTSGWSLLMKVNEKDRNSQENETAEIYVFGRTAGSDVHGGMTIIAIEPKELAVVNIVGQGSIGEMMRKKNKARPTK
ncbi:MAG TPA: hypothetical protein VNO50_01540 [Pyrinomonadaceae bacterium]|nr:hypothetical protein [Pyrinomonadaceae bacterium]